MSRSRRLSLRTRMLVLTIGVASAFLLVMGIVSTVFIADRLSSLFAQNLVAAATSNPSVPNGYAAVRVFTHQQAGRHLTGRAVQPLTGHIAGTRELAAAVRQMDADHTLQAQLLSGKAFDVPRAGNGPRLRGAAAPAQNLPGGAYVIVAQPVSILVNQVRPFILAELITGGALIALLAIGGEWLIGAGLDPLDKMAVTANEITSRGDLTARMPDASDGTEVGRLGSAINTMLDRIQQAFGARQRSEQRVREFAADASHELRTPLTTIRGYAELYRQGALGPDQLPSAMRRIEQEAQRMSTLVAELLELARLDRTSSLDLTETDLAGVVRDAVADAVAVEPDRPVQAEAPPRLVAVVDERRIRQVLANLLGNVRAHTPVDTPVVVRLGRVTGGVLIEVADAGPGMSSEDAARAFDRFHRAAERLERTEADRTAAKGTAAEHAGVERTAAERTAAERTGAGHGNAGDGDVSQASARHPDAGDGNDRTEWVHGAPSLNGHGAAGTAGRARIQQAGQGRGGDIGNGTEHGVGPGHANRTGHASADGPASRTGHPSADGPASADGHAGRTGHPSGHGQVSMRERGSKERATGGGSGLGLSIVQAIAAAHGGQATLESWPGRGTRVRIWLPTRTAP